MRRNQILSNIERAQSRPAQLRPAAVSSLKAHEARESARAEAVEEASGMDEPEETGGVKGISEAITKAAMAGGFRRKQEITIEFIKNSDGEIIGARLS